MGKCGRKYPRHSAGRNQTVTSYKRTHPHVRLFRKCVAGRRAARGPRASVPRRARSARIAARR